MWRALIGILLGLILTLPMTSEALRFARPPEFGPDWNTNTVTQLNDVLLQMWNTVNGRYQLDVVTADPDGSRACDTGELVYFDTATERLCLCTSTSTTDWDCVDLTD